MLKFITVNFFLIYIIYMKTIESDSSTDCPILNQCFFINNNEPVNKISCPYLNCSNFVSFSDLNTHNEQCAEIEDVCAIVLLDSTKYVNSSIILDSSLNFTNLINILIDSNSATENREFKIILKNLFGLAIEEETETEINSENEQNISVLFDSSKFNVYMNKKKINGCDDLVAQKKYKTVFNSLEGARVEFGDIEYPEIGLCSLLFQNSRIQSLDINFLKNFNNEKKLIKFVNPVGNFELNSRIKTINLGKILFY